MDAAIDTLISLIYRCALGAKEWPQLIEQTKELFAADAAALLAPANSPLHVPPLDPPDCDPEDAARAAAVEETAAGLQHGGFGEQFRTGILSLAADARLAWHRLLIATDQGGPTVGCLICLRTPEQPPFGAEVITQAKRLAHHFVAAQELAARLMPQQVSLEMLHNLHFSFLCLDDTGRLLCCDDRLRALLDEGETLHLAAGGLTTAYPEQTRRLRHLVRSALSESDPGSGMMQVSRPCGAAPLTVLVMPARKGTAGIQPDRPAAWVMVCNQQTLEEAQVSLQASAYNLTAAESRLVHQLLNGLTVQECAKVLEVSPNTVRWHLKRIFHKTGVTSQTALVRTFMACPLFKTFG